MAEQQEHLSADGKWRWDGTNWVPTEGGGQPPPPPKGKRPRWLIPGLVALVVVFVFTICVSAMSSTGSKSQPSPTPSAAAATKAPAQAAAPATQAPQAPPTAAPAPPAPANKVFFQATGSGIKTTDPFDAPNQWKLFYKYDCSNFGRESNFQIFVYQGSAPVDVAANAIGSSGEDSSTVYHGGAMHLSINTACAWSVRGERP